MAEGISPDTLWLDEPALRWELNVTESDATDVQLARLRGAAIDEISRYVRLPLRPCRLTRDGAVPAEGRSFLLTDAPYLLTVENVEYWTEVPVPGQPPTETWMDPGTGLLPVLDLSPQVLDEPWGPWWIRPKAVGWPAEARRLRVTVMTGLKPAEHQAVQQAIVMLVRDYYDGVSVADRMPAWWRRLSGMPYRCFWNPRMAA